MASQFGEGLFQAALAGALLFNPDRAADPMAIARAFTVLFLPYSLLGPFAGALMDRWDRRLVIVGANAGRAGAGCRDRHDSGRRSRRTAAADCGAAHQRPVAVRHVRPVGGAARRGAARRGGDHELGGHRDGRDRGLPGRQLHAGAALDSSGPAIGAPRSIVFLVAIPVLIALLLAWRFGPRVLGPDDSRRAIHGSVAYAVIMGWLHGARTVLQRPTVAGTLSGLAAHRMVVGINSLLLLVLVHHLKTPAVGGLGTALLFFGASGLGAFLATVLTPASVRRWGRYATANGALLAAAVIQVAAAGLVLQTMVVCSFFLGVVRPGDQAVRRLGDPDGRRRRAARTRLRGAGCAVLGGVHRLDHRGGDVDSRRRPRTRVRGVRVGALSDRAARARHFMPSARRQPARQ